MTVCHSYMIHEHVLTHIWYLWHDFGQRIEISWFLAILSVFHIWALGFKPQLKISPHFTRISIYYVLHTKFVFSLVLALLRGFWAKNCFFKEKNYPQDGNEYFFYMATNVFKIAFTSLIGQAGTDKIGFWKLGNTLWGQNGHFWPVIWLVNVIFFR